MVVVVMCVSCVLFDCVATKRRRAAAMPPGLLQITIHTCAHTHAHTYTCTHTCTLVWQAKLLV